MDNLNFAAVNFGENMSYRLDHLIPLCDLLSMPLIVDHEQVAKIATRYYPSIDVQLISGRESLLTLSRFDGLFVSDKYSTRDLSWPLKHLFKKNVRFFYTPHGNSDKGNICKEMDQFESQDLILIYGNQMRERLEKKGKKSLISMGNLRKKYYEKHSFFFRHIVQQEILRDFDKRQTTFLYAPSWKDEENSSSFDLIGESLIENLPEQCSLIVKLHPFLENSSPAKLTYIMEKYQAKNIRFLLHFPLVYPLFELIDIYLGDFSSLGYDFLSFDHPMFFFDPSPEIRNLESKTLYQCGIDIPKEHFPNPYPFIFSSLKKNTLLSTKRKQMDQQVFDQEIDIEILKQNILRSYEVGSN